ncbi:MAG TPA: type I-E CRISPR-associated endoribonuclease Cas2e [Chloroflexota bacterium]|nr:type I-E CRISPR-associated endoribonuclease Cas2e [Chloroflexota bacterium]
MVIFVLEKVPTSLRGELTRWMLEPKTGVFVGRVSAMVRDRLWEKICSTAGHGGCIMAYSADTEQGFAVRSYGISQRSAVDFEGLTLIRIP